MVPDCETMEIFMTGLTTACLCADENDRRIDAAGEKRDSYRAIVLEVLRRIWVTIHQDRS